MTTDNKALADRLLAIREVCGDEDCPTCITVREAAAALTSPQADKARGEVLRIGELIRTQDNRITAHPVFVVEQKRYVPTTVDHADGREWYDPSAVEVYDDAGKAERDADRAADGSRPVDWQLGFYKEVWEFVTACFTEQGCKDYLAANGHNLKEPRIYAYSAYRNAEWQIIREHLSATPQRPVDAVPDAELWKAIREAKDPADFLARALALLQSPRPTPKAGGDEATEFTLWYESSGADNWGTRDAATAAFHAGRESAMSTPQPQGDAIPRLANCGRYQATDNTGQTYYLNHANEWQTFQGTQQVSGDGFTAADMMDARAEERSRLSTPQVSGGGEVEAALMVVNDAANEARHSGDYQRANALVRARVTLARAALSTPQARPDGGEVIRWPNWCDTSVPEALRYLSKNERPKGGCERFNAEHLLQLANEIELMAKKLREAHPAPAPDVARLVEAAKEASSSLHLHARSAYCQSWDDADRETLTALDEALAPFTAAQQEPE